jgi:hypothetical protein
MNIGRAHLQAFKAAMRLTGQTILVHENFNTPEATYFEAKGMKVPQGKTSVVFQFPEALDIPVGAVLQVKGSRDYWRVTDAEDIIQQDVFINFETRVEKINLAGEPTRPVLKGGNTYNLQGPHSRVNIHSNDSSVNISHQVTENVFADMRQVIQTHVQNEDDRRQILKDLDEMEEAKGSTGFVQKYQNFIASAANHMSLLAPFIPALTQLLGVPSGDDELFYQDMRREFLSLALITVNAPREIAIHPTVISFFDSMFQTVGGI